MTSVAAELLRQGQLGLHGVDGDDAQRAGQRRTLDGVQGPRRRIR